MARAKGKKAAQAAEAPSATIPAASSPNLSKGDIVWIDYEGWTVSPNGTRALFDTTNAELAKKEGKFDDKKVYAEFPIVVGHGRLLPGLDEAILAAEVGKMRDADIPPERGAGDRDPKLVELHPLREFLKQEIHPELGMEVVLRGKKGTITQVTGGRVRVDFNNPLAGRSLHYRFTITKKAETPEDRLRGVLEMDYGLPEKFEVSVKRTEAEIVVPDVCKTDERWFVSKFRVVADLRDLLGFTEIRFVERYEKPAPKPAPPKEKEETKAEEPAKEAPKEEPSPPPPEERRPPPEEERAEEELPPEEKAPEEL